MIVKDLEVSKELSGKELAAVRGGFNIGYQGDQFVGQSGLLNFASPVTAVYVPTMPQIDTSVNINLANMLGSIAGVGQS